MNLNLLKLNKSLKNHQVFIKPNEKNEGIIRSAIALKVSGLPEDSKEQGGYYVPEFSAEKDKVYELSPI
jgi:hypothetical protein